MAGGLNIAGARQHYSDEEILDFLSKNSSEYNIQGALEAGYSAKEILDELSPKQAEAAPPASEGIIPALQQGAASAMNSVGSLARRAGATEVGPQLQEAAKGVQDPNYVSAGQRMFAPKEGDFSVGIPFTDIKVAPGYLPEAIAENAPQIGATIAGARTGAMVGAPAGPWGAAAGALAGGAIGSGVISLGSNIDSAVAGRTGNANDEANAEDLLRAGTATAAEAGLDALGARFLGGGSVLKNVVGGAGVKQAAKEFTKAGAVNTATSAAGDAANQVALGAGRENFEYSPESTIQSALVGAGTAGALNAPKVAKDVTASVKLRNLAGLESQASTVADRYVARAEDNIDNLKNTKKAAQATKEVRSEINTEIQAARKDMDLDQSVENVIESAKSGRKVTKRDLATVTESLQGTERGEHLLDLVKQAVVVERFTKGKEGDNFKGGLSSVTERILANRVAQGLAAGGSIWGLTMASTPKVAATAMAAAPYVAGAAAGHVGMRYADHKLGLKSPAHTFADRFSTGQKFSPKNAPDAPADPMKAAVASAKLVKAREQLKATSLKQEEKQAAIPVKEAVKSAKDVRFLERLKATSEANEQKAQDELLAGAKQSAKDVRYVDGLKDRSAKNQLKDAVDSANNVRYLQKLQENAQKAEKAGDKKALEAAQQSIAAIRYLEALKANTEKNEMAAVIQSAKDVRYRDGLQNVQRTEAVQSARDVQYLERLKKRSTPKKKDSDEESLSPIQKAMKQAESEGFQVDPETGELTPKKKTKKKSEGSNDNKEKPRGDRSHVKNDKAYAAGIAKKQARQKELLSEALEEVKADDAKKAANKAFEGIKSNSDRASMREAVEEALEGLNERDASIIRTKAERYIGSRFVIDDTPGDRSRRFGKTQ